MLSLFGIIPTINVTKPDNRAINFISEAEVLAKDSQFFLGAVHILA